MSETTTTVERRNAIANEVRALIGRRRISASELARRVGWSQPYLAKRMVGAQPFDADDLWTIADALGVTMATLLPREQREPTATYGQPGVPPRLQPQAMTVGAGSRWSPPPQPVKPGPRVRTTLTGL